MKKIVLLVALLVATSAFAQYDKQNEIRLNAFSILAARNLDISYERLLNEESAVGASFAFDLTGGDKFNLFGINQSYAITPYYRYYFPLEVSNGLFLEAFLSANGGKNKIKYDDGDSELIDIWEEGEEIDGEDFEQYRAFEYSDFAFGIGGGYKYASAGGFVAELYAGAGRNLSGDLRTPVVLPRLGLSFGFRF